MSLFLLVGVVSFSITVYAQRDATEDLQAVIVDTVKRTARKQVEQTIQEGTQKTLGVAADAGKKLDEAYSGKSITWLQEKSPFIHDKIYLPIDALRVKQSIILEKMVTDRNTSPTSIPDGVKKVSETLNTTRGFFTETSVTDNDPDRISASSSDINQAVANTSIDPGETLGKTYTIFLKLIAIIFASRILFYSICILIIFAIISKIAKIRTAE